MDETLRQMLVRIDNKIENLQRARATLLEEFDERPPRVLATPSANPMEELAASLKASSNGTVAEPRTTTKEDIIEFLIHSGPRTRKVLSGLTGIPEGTIAFVMRDKNTFRQNSDGRWDVTDAVRISRTRIISDEPTDADY